VGQAFGLLKERLGDRDRSLYAPHGYTSFHTSSITTIRTS
jgi:hypothetical protein